jgi:hypothetical protein
MKHASGGISVGTHPLLLAGDLDTLDGVLDRLNLLHRDGAGVRGDHTEEVGDGDERFCRHLCEGLQSCRTENGLVMEPLVALEQWCNEYVEDVDDV